MATAADYLQLSQTQVTTGYKLRTRNVDQNVLVATNIAPNYRLSVLITSELDGVIISPESFVLGPNESTEILVTFSSGILESYPAGTLSDLIDFTVSAEPVIVPEIPIAPPSPELPPAPRQITARVEILPNSFTFTEELQTREFVARLFVDGAVVNDARFNWQLNDNIAEAFTNTNGQVKAIKRGLNRSLLQASVTYPPGLSNAVGLASIASNIPVYATELTKGNLSIKIQGMPTSVSSRVRVSGIESVVFRDAVFENIPSGEYAVIPEVVIVDGLRYNPISGGGRVYVEPGATKEVIITYQEQPIPNPNSIVVLAVKDNNNNELQPNAVVRVGQQITVYAQTYRDGVPYDLGDITINATNTREGSLLALRGRDADGKVSAKFTIDKEGEVSIVALNRITGSTPVGKLQALRQSAYNIKISAPSIAVIGQCIDIDAVVLENNIQTNIPVEITANGVVVQQGSCATATEVQQFGSTQVSIGGVVQEGPLQQTINTGTELIVVDNRQFLI